MIRFPTAAILQKTLDALQTKNDLPAGHVFSHTQVVMHDDDFCEVTSATSTRCVVRLFIGDCEGTPGLTWLLSSSFREEVKSMIPNASLTLVQEAEGVNMRSGYQIINGKEVQKGNRIVSLYPDDVEHFDLLPSPTTWMASVNGELLSAALMQIAKFGSFGPEETRLVSVILKENLQMITGAKDTASCFMQRNLPLINLREEASFLFEGRFIKNLRAVCEGTVEIRCDKDPDTDFLRVSFSSPRGEVILLAHKAEDLMLHHHHLFDLSGIKAPIQKGIRSCLLQELQAGVNMQSPKASSTDSHLRNLVLHPHQRALFIYREGSPGQNSTAVVQALDEDSLLMDLATEFEPKLVNCAALRTSLATLASYKGECDGRIIDASLLRLRQAYTLRQPSGQKTHELFLEPALHTHPDLRIVIVCNEPADLPSLDDLE